nr:MAG TPA: repressor protein [Caudoviricetes sp.]
MSLLSRIDALRANRNNISVNKLEKECGLTRGSMCKWNDHAPSYEKIKKVADFFNVSPECLLEEEVFFSDEESRAICAQIVAAFSEDEALEKTFLIPDGIKKEIWNGTYKFSNVTYPQFESIVGRKKETAAPKGDGLSPMESQLMEYVRALTDDQKKMLLAQLQALKNQE